MIKYHIDNALTKICKESSRFSELTKEEHIRLYSEIKNATLQGIESKLEEEVRSNVKRPNNVNSLLLWVLEITDDKPSGYQKIKSEGSYMDVDSDFEQGKRDQVLSYLKEKYSTNRTCQIATFGTMAAKGAIRNSARALGYTVAEGEKVAKYITDLPGIKIQECIDVSKEFQELLLNDRTSKHIVDIARKLEGLPNSIGCHASGYIIVDSNTTDYFPLMSASRKDSDCIISQFEYKDIESNFCLKWDILGLQTLDIIHETVNLIKKNYNKEIDIYNIDVNDPNLYKLMSNGFLTFIFQFDGSAAGFIPKIKPQNINEVSDLSAILRPGPMSMGMVEQYTDAKFNNKKFDYGLNDQKLLDKVWDICKDSYGLMIYQENVIKCFVEISGFDEIQADLARRGVGKKIKEVLDSLEEKFVSGGIKNGYNKENLKKLFNHIVGFSDYGFNKSHSISYGYNTCFCAYLSYYYPLEFHTALLTICSNNTDDVRKIIKSLKERNFEIIPPDINKSDTGFTIEEKGIRFGLNAIKGVGASVSKKILGRKPKSGYKSLGHFIRRNIDLLNSKILESYTKAGCFNSFGYNKESILESIPYILEFLGIYKEANKYNTIFDLCNISLDEYIENCIIKRINKEDDLFYEIESLGLYISKHPLDDYELKTKYDGLAVNKISYTQYFEDGEDFITIGSISGILVKKTKAKLNMVTFNILDSESSMGAIMFPKTYSKYLNSDLLEEGKVLVFIGKLKKSETGTELIVNDLMDDANKYLIKTKENNIEFVINKNLKFILK